MAEAVDARVLRVAMANYLDALRAHREELDSLNVFPELVTLLAGRATSDRDAEDAAAAVRESFSSVEIEVHRGDQPGGAFLVGVE